MVNATHPETTPATKRDPRLIEAKRRAVAAAGGAHKAAAALGVKPQAVYQWSYVPAERVGQMAQLTNIPPHELRPDIFPPPAKSEAA
ncbi:MAG: helix-turn-helix domain-containing protein [Alphaproteobacteria bacterium]|nr:helix-turn-helix domain-containing protein [Alphaproteobacteria bacterium]